MDCSATDSPWQEEPAGPAIPLPRATNADAATASRIATSRPTGIIAGRLVAGSPLNEAAIDEAGERDSASPENPAAQQRSGHTGQHQDRHQDRQRDALDTTGR